MFISIQKIQNILELAHSDVWGVLKDTLNDPVYLLYWPQASWLITQSYVTQLDKNFSAASVSDVSLFVEPFLDWIEHRRTRKSEYEPWVIQNHQKKLASDSPCFFVSVHLILSS